MAQSISEKIKVRYQLTKNGENIWKECSLLEIPEEDKSSIVSVAIYPLLRKDGNISTLTTDISKYLEGFPILQTIAYPRQFSKMNVSKIQKTCPNLTTIVQTVEEGFSGTSSLEIKGSKSVSSTVDTRDDSLSGFASLIPSGQIGVNILEVPVKTVKSNTNSKKKSFITQDDLKTKLSDLEGKLEKIQERLGDKGKVPSTEDLEKMLGDFVGRLTDQQLDLVVNAVENININVDISALKNSVTETISDQINIINQVNNEKIDSQIQSFVDILAEMKSRGAKEDELLEYVKEQIPSMVSSNRKLVSKILLAIQDNNQTKESIHNIDEELGSITQNLSEYSGEILEGIANLGGKIDEIAKTQGLSEEDRNYLSTVMQVVVSQTTEAINNQGTDNKEMLGLIMDNLESKASSDDVSASADRIIKYVGSKLKELHLDSIPSKTFIENKLKGLATKEDLNSIVEKIEEMEFTIDIDTQTQIENIIQERFDSITSIQEQKTNKILVQFMQELQEIRQENSEDATKMLEKIQSLINGKLPELIATNRNLTDKIASKLSGMEIKADETLQIVGEISKKLDGSAVADDLIIDELSELRKSVASGLNSVSLSEEERTYLTSVLNMYFSQADNRQSQLIKEIKNELGGIVTAEDIENIISENLSNLYGDMKGSLLIMKNQITNNIIESLGDLDEKRQKDLQDIKDSVDQLFETEQFKETLEKILKDSDLAKTEDADRIENLIKANHAEELQSISGLVSSLSKIPTEEKIRDIVRDYTSGSIKLVMDKLGIADLEDNNSLLKILESRDETITSALRTIMAESKKKGMTIDDVKNYLASKEGHDTISAMFNTSTIVEQLKKSEQNQQEIMQRISAMQENMLGIARASMNIYQNAYGIAGGVQVGGGIQYIPVGFAPYITDPYRYGVGGGQNIRVQTNIEVETICRQVIAETIARLGITPQPNPAQESDKDKIIENLKNQIAEKDKKIAELSGEIQDVKKELAEIKKLLAKKTQEQENDGKTDNDKDKNKEKDKDQKKTIEPIKKEEKEPRIKDLPKVRDASFIKESVKDMEKLAEPKLTRTQKFKKWLKRHPLALTAIGIGAGAVLGAGAGVLTAGGIGAFISQASWFVPTLKTLGIGAGVGLGLGGVAEVVGRVTGLGKKDRLYSKFIKQKNKCEKFQDKLQELDDEIQRRKEEVQATKDAMKSCKKLKQVKKLKKTAQKNLKTIRKLQSKARIKNSDYKIKVDEFLHAKEELNAYEEKNKKTMAMAGNLQKLRKAEEKKEKELNEASDEDEKEIIEEAFELEKDTYSKRAGADISKLGKNFKTGDKEAEDIISSVKDEKSDTMKRILADIKNRNSVKQVSEETIKYYRPDEIQAYAQKVQTAGNDLDKANLMKVLQDMKKVNEEADKKLRAERKMSLQDFFIRQGIITKNDMGNGVVRENPEKPSNSPNPQSGVQKPQQSNPSPVDENSQENVK